MSFLVTIWGVKCSGFINLATILFYTKITRIIKLFMEHLSCDTYFYSHYNFLSTQNKYFTCFQSYSSVQLSWWEGTEAYLDAGATDSYCLYPKRQKFWRENKNCFICCQPMVNLWCLEMGLLDNSFILVSLFYEEEPLGRPGASWLVRWRPHQPQNCPKEHLPVPSRSFLGFWMWIYPMSSV